MKSIDSIQKKIKGYDELKPSTVTDKNLLENSKKMQKKFKQLYEELF